MKTTIRNAEQSAPGEVFAIPVRENGQRKTFYTEVLPFVPGPDVEVLGEPVRMVAAQSVLVVGQDAFRSKTIARLMEMVNARDREIAQLKAAAQSAPAGECEAFTQADVTHEMLDAFKVSVNAHDRMGVNYDERTRIAIAAAMSAWQRTQAAGVPEGWRRAVYHAEECLTGCMASPDIARSLDAETVRKIIADLRATRFAMLAAAPAQPAVQEKCVLGGTGISASIRGAMAEASPSQPEVQRLREALEHARLFIRNGIELGYIRMPDADTPDPAHETLPMIDAALAASTGQEVEK